MRILIPRQCGKPYPLTAYLEDLWIRRTFLKELSKLGLGSVGSLEDLEERILSNLQAGELMDMYKEYKRAERDRVYTWRCRVLLNEGIWRKERNADN